MSSTNRERTSVTPSLKANRFDRVASLLISMLILSGASFVVLGLLWLATPPETVKVLPPYGDGGTGQTVATPELSEFDTPNPNELSKVAIAQPITELSKLLSPESIAAATQITIESVDRPSKDSRPPGPTPEQVPRWERWEVRYDVSSINAYAKQLDFFEIELGAVGGGKKDVDYASRLTDTSPTTRTAPGTEEKRLYFAWRGGTVQAMDRKLLQLAGIGIDRRLILQFFPPTVEDTLARLELENIEDGQVDKLRKTIFGVRPAGDGFEFHVIEQR